MILRIKVDRADFEAAESDGWVDGQFQGVWTYVELGKEEEYILKPSDDTRTEYRLFKRCNAFFYESQELLETGGKYRLRQLDVTVVIYC